jgi:hypothetical protein
MADESNKKRNVNFNMDPSKTPVSVRRFLSYRFERARRNADLCTSLATARPATCGCTCCIDTQTGQGLHAKSQRARREIRTLSRNWYTLGGEQSRRTIRASVGR